MIEGITREGKVSLGKGRVSLGFVDDGVDLVLLEDPHDAVVAVRGGDHVEVVVVDCLPIPAELLPPQQVVQVLVELAVGVVAGPDGALESLGLPAPALDHFEEAEAVVVEGTDHFDDVVDQLLLDDLVEGELLLEGGGGVDLQQPALVLLVQEDVVAEELEAVGVGRDGVHAGDEGLQHDVLDLPLHPRPLHPHRLQPEGQHAQGNLAAPQLLLQTAPALPQVFPLDAEVGEVDELVADEVLAQGVGLGADAGEPLAVDEGLEGVDAGDQHIDADVELEAVEEEGVADVLLEHDRLREDHLLQLVDEGNTPAPRQPHWLEDPVVHRILETVGPELFDEGDVLPGEQEGLRDYVEVDPHLAAQALHLLDVLLEQVLPGQLLVAQEVVHLLEQQQVPEVNLGSRPRPEQVPGVLQLEAVGQLVPVGSAVETAIDDVVDLLLGPNHPVEEHLFGQRVLQLVLDPVQHDAAPSVE